MIKYGRKLYQQPSTFGLVHILINNAGIGFVKLIEDITEEEYRKSIDINEVSVFLGMKAVVSSMKKTKNGSILRQKEMSRTLNHLLEIEDYKHSKSV